MAEKIVYTLSAKCKDCYRCIRVCPVKAISFSGSQANVNNERCIVCGTCIRECPQGAKTFRNDVSNVEMLLEESRKNKLKIAITLAPSFVCAFDGTEIRKIPTALKKLGFCHVAETAIGAYDTAIATAKRAAKDNKTKICTACPAAVNYVTMYRQDNTANLINVVSPMIAHAKKIKKKFGEEVKIIFAGPCVAKKSEILWENAKGSVEYALTFAELKELFADNGINLLSLEDGCFDEEVPGKSRFFPLPGGLLKTASIENDGLDKQIFHVSGFEDLKNAVDDIDCSDGVLIEPLFCDNGCINGPGIGNDKNIFEKRKDIINYASMAKVSGKTPEVDVKSLKINFLPNYNVKHIRYSEEEIRKVLEKTGKFTREDELNCGACGYDSCRDKAVAVLDKTAEPEMCIPFMRKAAEVKADKIFETSPNGIIITDNNFNILSMNDAFKRMFLTSEALIGKHISALFDPSEFYMLASSKEPSRISVVSYDAYGIKCRQIVYFVKDDKQYIGIFINITKTSRDKERLNEIKKQTLLKAKELLEHQIDSAKKMALFLGESTAKSEELLNQLLKILENDDEQ
ncbi:MAG: 4Fe-4S binding protein [Endomicrobium sp.]|jgi:iron only hydrogenase large subunit-like protein|nr:4Fe-4S binding protein [Endomicrobium sp.]